MILENVYLLRVRSGKYRWITLCSIREYLGYAQNNHIEVEVLCGEDVELSIDLYDEVVLHEEERTA